MGKSHSKAQAQVTTAKAQATAAAAKAQLASLPAKLTFYAGVVKFGIQVAVIVVSGAGACAAYKAWEVRKLKHQHASSTNVAFNWPHLHCQGVFPPHKTW